MTDTISVFEIEETTVTDTLKWAEDKGIEVDHLRSALEAGKEICDMCLLLSDQYAENLLFCRTLVSEGGGDPVINERRLPLLEVGERINNLIGYLILLQMDAMMSLISMMEAKTNLERLLVCKHAYTIIYDLQDKGLYKVISKEMKGLPEDVISSEERNHLWKQVRDLNRAMIRYDEVDTVRNKISAHKSPSFVEQISAYRKCNFKECFVNTYVLAKLAWIFHNFMSKARYKLIELEDDLFVLAKERLQKLEALRLQLESMN